MCPLFSHEHSKVQVNSANPPADETLNKLSELSSLIRAYIVQTDGHESVGVVAAHWMHMYNTVSDGESNF